MDRNQWGVSLTLRHFLRVKVSAAQLLSGEVRFHPESNMSGAHKRPFPPSLTMSVSRYRLAMAIVQMFSLKADSPVTLQSRPWHSVT